MITFMYILLPLLFLSRFWLIPSYFSFVLLLSASFLPASLFRIVLFFALCLYILNFIAYITAFVSFVFLMIRDTTYKFKLIFNIGTFVLVYFFNIMAIYLNQDIEKNNGFITLKYPSYMFIPAISCALQNSFFFYNYILYKYEHYNLLEIISVFPDQDCPICLDHLRQKEVAKLKCNHYYHKSCILLHFQHHKNCPICRTEIINPV